MSNKKLSQIVVTSDTNIYNNATPENFFIKYPQKSSYYKRINDKIEMVLDVDDAILFNSFYFDDEKFYRVDFKKTSTKRSIKFKVYAVENTTITENTQKYFLGEFSFSSGIKVSQNYNIIFTPGDIPFPIQAFYFEIERKSYDDNDILDFDFIRFFELNNLIEGIEGITDLEIFIPDINATFSRGSYFYEVKENNFIINTEFFKTYSTDNLPVTISRGLIVREDMNVNLKNLSPIYYIEEYTPQMDDANEIHGINYENEISPPIVLAYINIKY